MFERIEDLILNRLNKPLIVIFSVYLCPLCIEGVFNLSIVNHKTIHVRRGDTVCATLPCEFEDNN